LACAVEMVEALTIVLAVGVTRGWRSAIIGTVAALGTLSVIVAALGPALSRLPIGSLRLVIGGLLLVFGLQWLRKAILRASGFKPLHGADAVFAERQRVARSASRDESGVDWYTFTVSFKGVLLEGLEVAFIVVTFGGAEHNIGLAAAGAGVAAAVVLVIGAFVHRPLSRIPENTMKYAVGLLLMTFGIFWSAEGAGIRWPGSDGALPGLLLFMLLSSTILVSRLRRRHARGTFTGAMA
jgi:uncharacterized membrane protein